MPILTIQALSMSFEDRTLFQNVNLSLETGERLALVGANGCGKTTLLRLITGQLQPESGQVVLGKHVRLGYAAQEADNGAQGAEEENQRTVYEEALEVFRPLMDMEQELEQLHERLHADHSIALLHRQEELQTAYERGGGLTFRARTKSALIGLGFPEPEHEKPAKLLSGGQQVKLRLGRLLLSGADLLLLDEPTNHLDLLAVAWLEDFLSTYPGAVILVSHDRWFLDKAATKTAALAHGRLSVSPGGYSAYLKHNETQAVLARRHYDNQLAEIKRIEGIIEQQKRFNQERNYVTIASKEKQIERLRAELVVPDSALRELRFQFPPVPETGNEVLRLHDLSKSFGERNIFTNVSGLIQKGERAFILGANGCGKTTLLHVLRRQLRPEAGYFVWGANVRVGSYDQTLADVSSSKTVLDEVWDSYRAMTQTEVRSALGMFLFSGDDVFKTVNTLSGGERARIALLKLMLSGANVLLLDEPTNHLDIPSREALETALGQFAGTIIAVSHDRFFIRKLATKTYRLAQDGLTECAPEDAIIPENASQDVLLKQQKVPNAYQRKKDEAAQQRKLATALRRCEAEIARLETQTETLHREIEENAADYEAILALTAKLRETEARLEEQMARWEAFETQLTMDN